MSWSINVTGTKSAVAKKVTELVEKVAASPQVIEQNLTAAKAKLSSTQSEATADPKASADQKKAVAALKLTVADLSTRLIEAKEDASDVLVAKERILALVSSLVLEPDASDEPNTPAWNAVEVKAAGSRDLSEKGIVGARMAFSVVRTRLAID